ncbi:MAG: hypothetical protein K5745_02895 [Saccharofermentans sp.]|nr:hypothetical protein [Saccharofermentans sp.]
MFEPKRGTCFHCGKPCAFPSNWKNQWYICNSCLSECVPLLRRKKAKGLIFKSDSKVKRYTLWQPFKMMDLNLIKNTLEYKLKNNELDFEPTKVMCNGNFEIDEARGLFRVRNEDLELSPKLPLSEIKCYYVQLVYEERSSGDSYYTSYIKPQICIELNNMYVPYVDFDYDFPNTGKGLMVNKKKLSLELSQLMTPVLKRRPVESKKLILDEIEMLMEYNPCTASAEIGEQMAKTADAVLGEGVGDELRQGFKQ